MMPEIPTASYSPHFKGWKAVLMSLGVFVIGTEALVISPLLKDISAAFHISDNQSGLAVAAYGLAIGLTTPVLGGISDLTSRRLVMVASLLAFSAVALAGALATTYSQLLITRALCGLAAGTFLTTTYAYIGDQVPYEKRATATGRVALGWAASLVLGAPLGAAMGEAVGWRGALAAVSILGFVTALLLTRIGDSGQSPVRAESGGLLSVLHHAIGVPRAQALMLAHFIAMISFYGMYTYLGAFLRNTLEIGSAAVGKYFLAYGIGFVIATLNTRFVDRIGKPTALIAALCVQAIAMTLVPWLAASGPIFFCVLVSWGLSQCFAVTTTVTIASSLSEPLRGSVLALATGAAYLGMSAGSTLMGALFERSGYMSVALACALGSVLSAALYYRAFR